MPATKNAAKKVRNGLKKHIKARDLSAEATAALERGEELLKAKVRRYKKIK